MRLLFINWYLKYNYYFPLIIALLLPFGVNYAPIIALWIIAFFTININVKTQIVKAFQSKWLYVFWAFFAIHLIGYFFSNNKAEASWNIEIKINFLVLPFLILATSFSKKEILKIKLAFVLGCLLCLVYCMVRAIYLFYVENLNSFSYSSFTYFLHPSYFAMYLLFAILILLLSKKDELFFSKYVELKRIIVILMFVVGIIMASSKMGLIALVLILPITVAFLLVANGYKKTVFAFIGLCVVSVFFAYKLFPTPFERFKVALSVSESTEQIDVTSSESTAVRVLIWKQAIAIAKTNPLWGTTPGDVNDELFKSYKEHGLTGALEKKLNTHNQFLQTYIGTGLFGFILLMTLTVGLSIFSILKKNYLLLLFSLVIILNFLVESMLQTQAGFTFFVFFSCILIAETVLKSTSNNSSFITHNSL